MILNDIVQRILLRLIDEPDLCTRCVLTYTGWEVDFNYNDTLYKIRFRDDLVVIIDTSIKHDGISFKKSEDLENLCKYLNKSIADHIVEKLNYISYNL